MSALVSKPGITRLSTSSGVPKEWSQSWFRDFISDHLKLADVRNAVSPDGSILVGGNITSFGSLRVNPNLVLSPLSGNALTINAASGKFGLVVDGNSVGGSFGIIINAGTSSGNDTLLVRDQTGSTTYFDVRGDGLVSFGGGAQLCATLSALTNSAGSSAGTLTNAPAAGNPTKWFAINDGGTVRHIPAW